MRCEGVERKRGWLERERERWGVESDRLNALAYIYLLSLHPLTLSDPLSHSFSPLLFHLHLTSTPLFLHQLPKPPSLSITLSLPITPLNIHLIAKSLILPWGLSHTATLYEYPFFSKKFSMYIINLPTYEWHATPYHILFHRSTHCIQWTIDNPIMCIRWINPYHMCWNLKFDLSEWEG